MTLESGHEAGMGDARFFNRAGPFTLAQLAAAAGAPPPEDVETQVRQLTGVAPLQTATPSHLSVLHNSKYVAELAATRAGAVLVAAAQASRVPAGCVALVVRDPHAAWAKLAALFHPAPPIQPGVHPTAVIDPAAEIDPTAEIGPLAIIATGATIGPRCQIGPAAVIGANVVLGADCRVGAHASLSHAVLGDRVYIYPGARIGQEGFGFAITAAGFLSVPQLGRVVIEDDVEIGANSTVDRGASHDTTIGAGTRIDNLVQVAHNVRIGEHCALASQVGLSGSAIVGDFVQLAGQVGIAGHVRIGSRAQLGGQAGVMSDIPEGAIMLGSPAMPVREFFRNVAVLRKLARRGGSDSTGST